MEIKICSSEIVNGHRISRKQLRVLKAVQSEGSKNAAAKKLGLSVPVVHNYLQSIEEGTGIKLLKSTPKGSELTEEALKMLELLDLADKRCEFGRKFTVGCTPITQDLIMNSMPLSKTKGDIIISDDFTNMKLLNMGLVDIIFLDDPANLFSLESYKWDEIGSMDIIYVKKGTSHMRYKYGAQRIAYDYLDSIGDEYTIDGETTSINDLINSGKSFFIDEILLLKNGIKLESSIPKGTLKHTINAVYRKELRCIDRLMHGINKKRLI